jgi:2-polyprenyl-3-methyl-5-hydroxy-6-metoxy-1,4-benzoquinol methylase
MIFLEDSILLNLVNGEREHKNYGITHTIPHKLVDEKLFQNLIESYKVDCRVCGGGFTHYLSLGLSPLANNLNDKKNAQNDLYPLDLNFCNQCSNTQLSVVVPPEKMFDNYFYLSSTSKQFRDHFIRFAKELKTNLKLNKKSVVVDIGSNDGIFLDPVQKLGIKAIGVEPAKNVAKIANSNKLTTFPEYFNKKTVKKISEKYGKADVVTAFNVFAHGDGLREILENTEILLKKDGEFIFEIQYLLRTIKDLTFDNVYHEHVNYWCLLSILNFFENSNMKVYKVKEVDTHGGSLRVYATKNKNKRLDNSVKKYIELEKRNKLDKIETYYRFAKNVENIKSSSLKKIKEILENNEKIIGYGAPAKATTVLNYFGINDSYFKYVLEDSEIKQNKYIPETNIQIKSKKSVNVDKYEYILVLAWNFFDAIVQNNQAEFQKSKFIKLK